MTIGHTQYPCFLTVRVPKFYNQGVLAMTTNETFIWLDSNQPPKIIDANYRPPRFPLGF